MIVCQVILNLTSYEGLTARTYFSAGCSKSRSCSCAMSSKREGLREDPTSLKNSIECQVLR